MATNPVVDITTQGDGSTTQFVIPFPFISRNDVYVQVDGSDAAFTWVSDGMINITPAPAAGAPVRRWRDTPGIEPIHQFRDGVPFLPGYIDDNNRQNLYVMQEAVYTADQAKEYADEALRQAQLAAQAAAASRDASIEAKQAAQATLAAAQEAANRADKAAQDAAEALYLVQQELGALPPSFIPVSASEYTIKVTDSRRKLIARNRCTIKVPNDLPVGFYCEVMRDSLQDVTFEAVGTSMKSPEQADAIRRPYSWAAIFVMQAGVFSLLGDVHFLDVPYDPSPGKRFQLHSAEAGVVIDQGTRYKWIAEGTQSTPPVVPTPFEVGALPADPMSGAELSNLVAAMVYEIQEQPLDGELIAWTDPSDEYGYRSRYFREPYFQVIRNGIIESEHDTLSQAIINTTEGDHLAFMPARLVFESQDIGWSSDHNPGDLTRGNITPAGGDRIGYRIPIITYVVI